MAGTPPAADGKAFGDWKVDLAEGMPRCRTHGTAVWGHQFALIKEPGQCDGGVVWIEWSTTLVQAKALKDKTDVHLEVDADGTVVPIDLELMGAAQLTPDTTVLALTNYAANERFAALLQHSKSLKVRVVGPAAFVQKLDVKADTFSLDGFGQAYAAATRMCARLPGR